MPSNLLLVMESVFMRSIRARPSQRARGHNAPREKAVQNITMSVPWRRSDATTAELYAPVCRTLYAPCYCWRLRGSGSVDVVKEATGVIICLERCCEVLSHETSLQRAARAVVASALVEECAQRKKGSRQQKERYVQKEVVHERCAKAA